MAKKLEFEISAESLAIIRDGQAACRWFNRDKTWEAWVRVGKAFLEVRIVAMHRAGVNRPFGPRFTEVQGLLLRQFKFTEYIKDSGDRARLVEVMETLPAIEAWRKGLTEDQRRMWNHPTTVLRRYKADIRKQITSPDDAMFRPPSMKEKNRALRAEVRELRKGAPLPWAPNDSPADKARAVMEHLSIVEAEELALALLQAVKEARTDDPTDTPAASTELRECTTNE
jgi:hypothetical protein